MKTGIYIFSIALLLVGIGGFIEQYPLMWNLPDIQHYSLSAILAFGGLVFLVGAIVTQVSELKEEVNELSESRESYADAREDLILKTIKKNRKIEACQREIQRQESEIKELRKQATTYKNKAFGLNGSLAAMKKRYAKLKRETTVIYQRPLTLADNPKYAIPPEGCHSHLTAGKKYKIKSININKSVMSILDDGNFLIHCIEKKSQHLNGQDWKFSNE